jgi:hypothetical protein
VIAAFLTRNRYNVRTKLTNGAQCRNEATHPCVWKSGEFVDHRTPTPYYSQHKSNDHVGDSRMTSHTEPGYFQTDVLSQDRKTPIVQGYYKLLRG